MCALLNLTYQSISNNYTLLIIKHRFCIMYLVNTMVSTYINIKRVLDKQTPFDSIDNFIFCDVITIIKQKKTHVKTKHLLYILKNCNRLMYICGVTLAITENV